ncbi:MAG: histidine phosphatase family protein [Alphaproteobacteria bacterium]
MTTRSSSPVTATLSTKGDIITRVGARTDLPLTETERGTNVGRYLKDGDLIPAKAFAAPLKRTVETAKLAIEAMGCTIPLELDESFREVDYGPDENKPEEEVIARIGQDALDKWNKDAIVPDGWKVDPQAIINNWLLWGEKAFKTSITKRYLSSPATASSVLLPILPETLPNLQKNTILKSVPEMSVSLKKKTPTKIGNALNGTPNRKTTSKPRSLT